MAEKDYSHRDVVDKLGVKPGDRVAFDAMAWPLDDELVERVLARATEADETNPLNVVFVAADPTTDITAAIRKFRPRLHPAGGVWVLTRKRGQPGYLDQREVISAGLAAGLVDNKSCSVSDTVSAIRFVTRKEDRPRAGLDPRRSLP